MFYRTDNPDVIQDETGREYFRLRSDRTLWNRADHDADNGIEIVDVEIEPRPARLPSEWPENKF